MTDVRWIWLLFCPFPGETAGARESAVSDSVRNCEVCIKPQNDSVFDSEVGNELDLHDHDGNGGNLMLGGVQQQRETYCLAQLVTELTPATLVITKRAVLRTVNRLRTGTTSGF